MENLVKQWKALRRGDIVDIIAPASGAPEDNCENGFAYIKSLGLVPRYSEKMIQTDLFFASPLQEQWEQLKAALHSDSKVIWCLRGGYGSMRLIPLLEGHVPPSEPKLLIGFSDITSLHLYFNQKWNWPSLHTRTISQLHPDWEMNDEHQKLTDLLFGRVQEVSYENLIPLNQQALSPGRLVGTITGGNLRLIQSSLGTPWEIKTKGKILFIEDVSERGYSVDRMMEQLNQANLLNGISALLIGDFTEGLEKDGKNLVPASFERLAKRLSCPVISGLPCGHAPGSNSPLPFNTQVRLDLGSNPRLLCRVNN